MRLVAQRTSNVTSKAVSVFAALTALAPSALPDDWPRWRGPDGDNVSKESGWNAMAREDPLWHVKVGSGYSSPAISGGLLFITGYFENDLEQRTGFDRVSCLDAETGAERWSRTYPTQSFANEHAGGALSTPTVLGDTLFVATRGGEVRSYTVADGELLWRVDLVERHQVEPGRYGFASSPYVLGDCIVLNAGRTLALDRATGETVWISESYDANFSTVAPMNLGEQECLVVFGGGGLIVLNAANGEHVNTYPFRKTPRNVEGATPIVLGERVVISSAYEQGVALVDFSGDEPVEVWRNRSMRTKMAGCTLYDGHLYGFDESMLKCIDLEGEEQWRVRGLGHGALSIADGQLLITTSEGELIIAKATPEAFKEDMRRAVIDDGVFWTAPVLMDGRIYVRGSLGDLVCLDHRGVDAAGGIAQGSEAGASELPDTRALVGRHLSVSGLGQKALPALQMTGILDQLSLGLAGVDATWTSGEDGLWHTQIYIPPYDAFMDYFFDGEIGWELTFRGNKLIDGARLAELQSTNGFRSIFDPVDFDAAKTAAREVFRGTECFRVDERVNEGNVRSLYFDVDSGLLFARTSPRESTVIFGDWREVVSVKLPFRRTVFDLETGEESRWIFDEVTFEALDYEEFVLPDELAGELAEDG